MTTYLVKASDDGKKMLTFLGEHLDLSKKKIKEAIDAGGVQLNGTVEYVSTKAVKKGDRLTFYSREKAVFTLPILLKNKHWLVCNKPSGLVTDETTFCQLLSQPVFLVHRLDKGTSGVILLARTVAMQKQLMHLFKQREVKKIYVALVQGALRSNKGTIESKLSRKNKRNGKTVWESTEKATGKRALTHYQCLKKTKAISLVQCDIETGRTHQIRVHLSEMGHPVVGDDRYGKKEGNKFNRLCLHAYRLIFFDPDGGKRIQVTAPLPQLFKI